MSTLNKECDFVANVVYKAAIEEEKEWRKRKENKHDIILIDQLLEEIRELGYPYKYLADITNRKNTDKELLNIILGYIGQFQDEYISAELVGTVGQKGNKAATEIILNNYTSLSNNSKCKHAIFYDNALNRLKDKRYISAYIELLKVPEDAIKLPLTMIMLGKWNSEKAKPYFFDYLNSDLVYLNKHTSDLVFISLEALSFYHDPNGDILKAFERKLISDDKDLIITTKKAIKRLKNIKKR